MKNQGTNTWDSTYALGSRNPDGNTNWGVASLPVIGTIATGAGSVFTNTFTAPATPGTYHFTWRMNKGGIFFGDQTPDIAVVVSADAAQFMSDTTPLTINAGTDFYIQNTMVNTGTSTWTTRPVVAAKSCSPNPTAAASSRHFTRTPGPSLAWPYGCRVASAAASAARADR